MRRRKITYDLQKVVDGVIRRLEAQGGPAYDKRNGMCVNVVGKRQCAVSLLFKPEYARRLSSARLIARLERDRGVPEELGLAMRAAHDLAAVSTRGQGVAVFIEEFKCRLRTSFSFSMNPRIARLRVPA